MSYYIMIILSSDVKWEKARIIFDKYNLGTSIINNSNILSQITRKSILVNTTKENCVKKTVIGLISENLEIIDERIKDVPMYTYGGWQASVGGAWVDKFVDGLKKLPVEQKKELLNWNGFLQEILESNAVNRIGILKHFYSGDIEKEDFSIKRTEEKSIQDIDENYILYIGEDIVYELTN